MYNGRTKASLQRCRFLALRFEERYTDNVSLWQRFTARISGSKDAAPVTGGTNGISDTALVDAARRGDRRAFDGLVAVYQGQLKGFVSRRVGLEAVDDLAQDVWIAVWNALPRFERRACFRTFLYGIAVHKCMDYHRSQKRSAGAVPSSALTEGAMNAALAASPQGDLPEYKTPEELYAAAESRETVRIIVDTLPPAQREVLDLYYWAELTLQEIARVLGRNLNTVKYQFYRGHDLVAQGLAGVERMTAVATRTAEERELAPREKMPSFGPARVK
jgi:RNA polymerase sigma-70 factor (ECF subfamily)